VHLGEVRINGVRVGHALLISRFALRTVAAGAAIIGIVFGGVVLGMCLVGGYEGMCENVCWQRKR
jgi:hypothetical protein